MGIPARRLGGRGGHSLAIAFTSAAPTQVGEVTLLSGPIGAGGTGGNPGADGIAALAMSFDGS